MVSYIRKNMVCPGAPKRIARPDARNPVDINNPAVIAELRASFWRTRQLIQADVIVANNPFPNINALNINN
jgi:hypothetical protein